MRWCRSSFCPEASGAIVAWRHCCTQWRMSFGHAQAPSFKAPSRRLQTRSAPRLEAVLTLLPTTAVNATSVFVGEQQSDESRRMSQTLSESNSLSGTCAPRKSVVTNKTR
jgi:hypothetical protein